MNKKSVIILLVLAFILIGIVTGVQILKNHSIKFREISYEDFVQLIDNNDTFGLLIEKDNCPYCEQFFPKLETIVNEKKLNHNIYYINVAKLSEEDYKNFNKKISYSGTPTTVFFSNGQELDLWTRIDGNVLSKDIKEKLIVLKYLNN